jgi:hypothetical protein
MHINIGNDEKVTLGLRNCVIFVSELITGEAQEREILVDLGREKA